MGTVILSVTSLLSNSAPPLSSDPAAPPKAPARPDPLRLHCGVVHRPKAHGGRDAKEQRVKNFSQLKYQMSRELIPLGALNFSALRQAELASTAGRVSEGLK